MITSFKQPDGSVTTASSVVGPFDTTQYNIITVGVFGTYAGVTLNFEASIDNGINWFPVSGVRTASNVVESAPILATNATVSWDIVIGPFNQFRVRTSAWTSGTATIQTSMGMGSYEPNPAITLSGGVIGDASAQGGAFSDTAGLVRPLAVNSMIFNGTSWDRGRTPNIFKTTTATASGNTTVWTPAAGKKFRLMGYVMYLTESATQTAAGDMDFVFNDSGAAIGLGFSDFVNTTAVAGSMPAYTGVVQLGNGYLSSTINNVLQINLSTALTAGKVRVTVWGTEE